MTLASTAMIDEKVVPLEKDRPRYQALGRLHQFLGSLVDRKVMPTKRLGKSHAAIVRKHDRCHEAPETSPVAPRSAECEGEIIVHRDAPIPPRDGRLGARGAHGPCAAKVVDRRDSMPYDAIELALHAGSFSRDADRFRLFLRPLHLRKMVPAAVVVWRNQ
jgi:hypothetical protein